jgi:hypothetical protein
MLSASLLQQSGEFKDAIDYALKAEKILEDTMTMCGKQKYPVSLLLSTVI